MSNDERYIVGLDVGSSSTKATAFTVAGRLAAQASVAYQPDQPEAGVAEYPADVLTAAATGALAQMGRVIDLRAVESIAIDAMMSGVVPIDSGGKAVAPYTTTMDVRFAVYLDRYVRANVEVLRSECGSSQATLAPKIQWIRETRPDLATRTAKFVLAPSLIGGFLAGLDADRHYVDPTYLWTTGLADSRQKRWSPTLLKAADVDPITLPTIVPPTQVVGEICSKVAAATGLRKGTPIVAGCGDQSAGYLGAGITEPGIAADSAGTYAVFAVASDSFVPGIAADGPDVACAPTDRLYHYQNVVIGGGLTRQWAAGILAGTKPEATADLEQEAANMPPGAEGLIFLPYLGGIASPPDATLRGALQGLSWAHGRGHIYRAVLESIAFEHAAAIDRMGSGLAVRRIIGYGGGSRSQLWNTIKCDVMGIPFESLGQFPVAELGVAMLGAEGVGLVDDAARATQRIVPRGKVQEPDPKRHEVYRGLLAAYRKAVATHVKQEAS